MCSDPNFRIAKGGTSATPPPLFNFTSEEIETAGDLMAQLQQGAVGAGSSGGGGFAAAAEGGAAAPAPAPAD